MTFSPRFSDIPSFLEIPNETHAKANSDAPSCKLQVFDATGKEIDKKDVKIDSAQKALMSVSMPKLPAGTYKVVWNAGCACGCNQHTSGKFTFVVAGP